MVGGVAVLGLDGVGIGWSLHQGGVEDIRPRGDKQALGEAALAAFARRLHQTGAFQGAQVLADLLARHVQLLGEACRGGRLRQGRQDAPADRRQRQQGGVQIVEQG